MTTLTYNNGRNTVTTEKHSEGYVLVARNIESGESMEVSNPIASYDEAVARASRFAGVYKPLDYDVLDYYLSERLGF
jgi:hypothetical protein